MREQRTGRVLTAFVLVVGMVAIRCDAGSPVREGAPFHVGVCTHFCQGKGIIETNLGSIKNAGITAIRDEVPWGAVEAEQGRLAMPEHFDRYVRRAAGQGVEVMLILDYANRFYDDGDRPRSAEAIEGFCRYAEFVVRHFGKDVRWYEIWNEWDIGIGLPEPYRKGGSPEDYVKLLRPVYERIKAIDPQAVVIAGGSTSGGVKRGWLEQIVKLGALAYCDVISIHSYNYNATFPERSPEACSAWMTGVQEMLRRYHDGRDVPFVVTEMGWPTHVARGGTDEQVSASYLARLYLLARTSPSFRGVWWYDFQDDGWNPEHNENNFGLVRPDLTPKPSYHVMADLSGLVVEGRYVDRLATDDAQLWILCFTREDRDCWAVWCGDDQDRQVVIETRSPAPELTIRRLGHKRHRVAWGFRDWVGRREPFKANQLSVVVGARPTLIEGDLSRVSIAKIISRSRQVSAQVE